MRVLYKREDGAVIVFDSQDGDEITAHIEMPDGTKYEPKLLDNLVSWGYWEPVEGSTGKAAPKKVFEPVDSDRLNRIVIAIDQNMSKREFGEAYGELTEAEDDAWDDIFKEISYFASQGIAVEIPAEVPDVFDTGLRAPNTVTIVKHLQGKHDQATHGKGGGSGYVGAKHGPEHFTAEKCNALFPMGKNGEPDYEAYNRNGQNLYCKSVLEEQGFNGKPRVVSAEEYENLVKNGAQPIHRGIAADTPEQVDAYTHQFMHGDDPFIGKGMFGDGTYFSSTREVGEGFSKENREGKAISHGKVIDAALDPQAKVIDLAGVRALEQRTFPNGHGNYPQDFYDDMGAFAASQGYDAIVIRNPKLSWRPDAERVNADYYLVLNRTAVIVKETP